jgi:hypothetical protein
MLPLSAFDAKSVIVKSSSTASGMVMVEAELAGKDAEFECFAGHTLCSALPTGEYVMVRANTSEGIYNDCTNVVIYKATNSQEKLGVYCWLNSGDSYTDVVSNTQSAGAFNIARPTVVAFFVPATNSQSVKDTATSNEALADFRLYGAAARKRLEQAGVEYKEAYVSVFQVQSGGAISIVQPTTGVGYYFAAPGKKSHITYGVLTDTDLLQQVEQYLGVVAK